MEKLLKSGELPWPFTNDPGGGLENSSLLIRTVRGLCFRTSGLRSLVCGERRSLKGLLRNFCLSTAVW